MVGILLLEIARRGQGFVRMPRVDEFERARGFRGNVQRIGSKRSREAKEAKDVKEAEEAEEAGRQGGEEARTRTTHVHGTGVLYQPEPGVSSSALGR